MVTDNNSVKCLPGFFRGTGTGGRLVESMVSSLGVLGPGTLYLGRWLLSFLGSKLDAGPFFHK